jgi:hypothetical protein
MVKLEQAQVPNRIAEAKVFEDVRSEMQIGDADTMIDSGDLINSFLVSACFCSCSGKALVMCFCFR